jgi:hypothetical protein
LLLFLLFGAKIVVDIDSDDVKKNLQKDIIELETTPIEI